MALPLNTLINSRYILSRFTASGGMADVYEASDIVTNKVVALKFLKEKYSNDDKQVERFKNEARFTSIFAHPHILKIYNVGEYNGQLFMSYELLKGKTLKEVLDNRSRLSFDEAIDYMLQICDAVYYVHRAEIIHNDLKPDNIFVLNDGNIKLYDFGIASHTFDSLSKEVLGSLAYVPYEVLEANKCSFQSDIYALGVIFYETLTGKLPYMGRDSKEFVSLQVVGEIPSVKPYGFINYKDIDYVVKKCLDRNLSNRYKTVKDLQDDIVKLKNHVTIKKESLFSRMFK